ncbi:hypothetical protein [Snodgrassella communis]|uniref:hypothetical protein n=1 Tax=Snodgrassella communis TaxID=2946699 RepID=UPI001EF50304|nr:hypothetical protein [Snodgrassella communis]
MINIINFIENEIKLSKGINKELYLKLDLLKKIALYMSQNKIEGKVDKIITLINMNTGYSEYRLINDCESDNKKLWIEYTYENDKVRLNPGDILVKMK